MSNKKNQPPVPIKRNIHDGPQVHDERVSSVLDGQDSYLCDKCSQINAVSTSLKHIEVEGLIGREVGLHCQVCGNWNHIYFETTEIIKAREELKTAASKALEFADQMQQGKPVPKSKLQRAVNIMKIKRRKYKRIYDKTQKELRGKYGIVSPQQAVSDIGQVSA